ncbi:hypothetical protein PCANC_00227 [Puccinia coronata f. sp. avenae]|uniref:Uncharacterized protein n=1 Tax=Puccinia coronata f. sp. avenae TaxID=200324 RepID=A0A2N5S6F3_9BASI|nr:hypothetical protein PCANC_16603 [Puccinia coronata f. sp. avenae]PLW58694.1 hypothetical protein PCANC_00227 [Puccinia coronata f. sp. avenae]
MVPILRGLHNFGIALDENGMTASCSLGHFPEVTTRAAVASKVQSPANNATVIKRCMIVITGKPQGDYF